MELALEVKGRRGSGALDGEGSWVCSSPRRRKSRRPIRMKKEAKRVFYGRRMPGILLYYGDEGLTTGAQGSDGELEAIIYSRLHKEPCQPWKASLRAVASALKQTGYDTPPMLSIKVYGESIRPESADRIAQLADGELLRSVQGGWNAISTYHSSLLFGPVRIGEEDGSAKSKSASLSIRPSKQQQQGANRPDDRNSLDHRRCCGCGAGKK